MSGYVLQRQKDGKPSVVTTGTLEMLRFTISWMTSRTAASILHLQIFSYVPSFSTCNGFRSISVSRTLMAMNFRIRYCVITDVTIVLAVSLSYETRGMRRALEISILRRASYRIPSGDVDIVSGALTLRTRSTSAESKSVLFWTSSI